MQRIDFDDFDAGLRNLQVRVPRKMRFRDAVQTCGLQVTADDLQRTSGIAASNQIVLGQSATY
jgi:hypothetical protein